MEPKEIINGWDFRYKVRAEPMDKRIGCIVTIINEELTRGHGEDGLSPLTARLCTSKKYLLILALS